LETFFGGSGNAQAYGINNLGQSVGESWLNSSSSHHAVLWQSGGGITDLGLISGTDWSNAQAIDDSGVAVGTSFATDGSIHRMFVWDSADGLQDADNLLDSSGAGWTLYGARGINDLGQITGYGESPSGQIDGVLLTPTPAPSSLALLAVGAEGLGGLFLGKCGSRDGEHEQR
jgi:probable HAF family extracellular repeat protein